MTHITNSLEAMKEGIQFRVQLKKYLDLGGDAETRFKKDNKNALLMTILGCGQVLDRLSNQQSAYTNALDEATRTAVPVADENGDLELATLQFTIADEFLQIFTQTEIVDAIQVLLLSWKKEMDSAIQEVDSSSHGYYSLEKSWKKSLNNESTIEEIMEVRGQTLELCVGKTVKERLESLIKAGWVLNHQFLSV